MKSASPSWPDHINFQGLKALVLGDVMLDRYVYGSVARISPEAPVPILSVDKEVEMPGGAANVARNIASLGGASLLIGLVGMDPEGDSLESLLSQYGGLVSDLVRTRERPTTAKTRFIAGQQQVLRSDQERSHRASPVESEALIARFVSRLPSADIVILSDYAKGVLTDEVIRQAIALSREAGVPVAVDPKRRSFAIYDGATIITPNLREAALASGEEGSDDASVERMGQAALSAMPASEAALITRGPSGLSLSTRAFPIVHIPSMAREVFDVSGAGDTVIATLSLAIAAGFGLEQSARLANLAAGIAVTKLGTATVGNDELEREIQSTYERAAERKILSVTGAADRIQLWRAQGNRIGFTNGCFDLVHAGHLSLLERAHEHCDRLVVGLNSDASVRRLKGPKRPVQNEMTRALVLASMANVDLVVIFGEDTPETLIHGLRPDVLLKGADYSLEQVVGADFVQSYGGKVALIELLSGHSTTSTIAQMAER